MSAAVDASGDTSHGGSVWPILVYLVALIGIIRIGKYLRNKFFRRSATDTDRGEYQAVSQVQDNELSLFSFGSKREALQVSDVSWSNKISFTLNGKLIEIVNPSPTQLLASYLRDTLGLKGTKLGCEEGGCGACSVVLQDTNGKVVAANSCLRLLCMNDGFSITTVEGIGSVQGGLSEEQQRLVATNGTQCGFCTPGWVTATRALRTQAALDGRQLHREDIEKTFDGNICRCTGYRPIMEALHSFCDDANPSSSVQKVKIPCHTPKEQCCTKSVEFGDIEEQVGAAIMCPSAANKRIVAPSSVCVNPSQRTRRNNGAEAKPLLFHDLQGNTRYYRPVSLLQLRAVLAAETKRTGGSENIMLVTGHTSIGVSKYLNDTEPFYTADKYQVSVDVTMIPAMTASTFNAITRELTIGAAVSIASFISLLQENGNGENKSVFSVVAEHLGLVANTQVRSVGSWAGNLSLFLRHPQFPSDVLLALTMAQATLVLSSDEDSVETKVSMSTFLTIDYQTFIQRNTVIIAVRIKDSAPDSRIGNKTVCFAGKTALREHNAHAMINFAGNFTITRDNFVIANAIVVGGAVTRTTLCSRTMSALQNQALSQQTLNQAMQALAMDLTAGGLAEAAEKAFLTPSFLMSSAQGYLYRAVLNCYQKTSSSLSSYLRSVIAPWTKPPSSGVEVFPLPRDGQAPVGAPVKKLEAPSQTTGEAVYPSDIALPSHGLHAALVFATVANVTLLNLDITAALAVKSVTTVLTAKDIPSGGVNELANGSAFLIPIGEVVPYVGAIIAIIVADTETAANEAVSLVNVQYGSNGSTSTRVVTNINQAKAANSVFVLPKELSLVTTGDADTAIQNAPYQSVGTFSAAGQYHFYMEAQAAVATPSDGDKISVTCGSQFPSLYLSSVAGLLNVSTAKLTVDCPRTGGGFGGKITGGVGAAAAAALTCKLLKRPVRVFNTRTADMNLLGGREEWQGRYRVGYDQSGRVLGLQYEFDVDAGSAMSDALGSLYMGMHWADNAYYFPNYTANAALYKTNTPARTSMRAPGVLQSCLATEMVMEHVASSLDMPLSFVQEANFIQPGQLTITGQPIPSPSSLSNVWNMAKDRSLFQQRLAACQQFNAANIFTKRGIAMAPVKYGIGWNGYNAGCVLMVSSTDGMVTVKHSGCEVGQGINTKVAQAVAMALSIPLSMVAVAWTSTSNVANGGCTGGSSTSEVTVQAAVNAAAVLITRLDAYRGSNGKSKTSAMTEEDWTKLISSVPTDVSLTAEGWYSPSSNPNGQEWQYFVYAACAVEVELDVLTGRLHVLSTEMVYDCGASLNPAVDCGQIEGALVLTLGYFFSERVRYDDRSGMLKTPGTWEYKPPLAADIPSSLRLTLIADSYNSTGILGSKAVGEPPMIVANAAYLALKMAISASRADAGVTGHFDLAVPATIEQRQAACLVHAGRFVIPKC